MTYHTGDCLTLQTPDGKYCAVYIAGDDGHSFQLAFLDYYEVLPPPANYFTHCSFHIVQFGTEDQPFAAFEAVTIDKAVLEAADGISRAGHIELPGMTGLSGMTPVGDADDVARYFLEKLANPDALQTGSEFLPFKRALMGLTEIAKRAVPVNPFRTVKLYRPEGLALNFWSIYGKPEPPGLGYTWGRLGAIGEYRSIEDGKAEVLKEKYRRLIEEKRAEGFREWPEQTSMILQFRAAKGWGAGDDLDFRDAIWDLVNRYLFWTGNGGVEGGDIGSGTVNLFFRVISAPLAIETIRSALAEQHISRPFLIAVEGGLSGNREGGIRIVYPENHVGEFNY